MDSRERKKGESHPEEKRSVSTPLSCRYRQVGENASAVLLLCSKGLSVKEKVEGGQRKKEREKERRSEREQARERENGRSLIQISSGVGAEAGAGVYVLLLPHSVQRNMRRERKKRQHYQAAL